MYLYSLLGVQTVFQTFTHIAHLHCSGQRFHTKEISIPTERNKLSRWRCKSSDPWPHDCGWHIIRPESIGIWGEPQVLWYVLQI